MQATREAIFARVDAHHRARVRQRAEHVESMATSSTPPVELLVAPTGSRKSTLMRAAAVRYVTEHPDKTVVILMPRHKLGDEQIEQLQRGASRRQLQRRGVARAARRRPGTPDPSTRASSEDVPALGGGGGGGEGDAQRRAQSVQAGARQEGDQVPALRCAAPTSGRSRSRPTSGSPRTNAWCTRCRRRSAMSAG